MVFPIIVIIYVGVIIYDYCPLKKDKINREKMVYLSLLGISFILLILIVMEVKLLSPSKLIRFLLKPIIST